MPRSGKICINITVAEIMMLMLMAFIFGILLGVFVGKLI